MALDIVKKEISLNVGQPNNFELICAMQGDNKSFEITATLYDVNKLYEINTNNIKIQGINPVGLKINENIDSHTTNTVTFTLTEKMLMYDGILRLVIIFTDNGQLTTFPFIIKVVNSPGNTTADDVKTISELVEEAKKWAMLSKSYAVGTDNEIRAGDATDNSKFYYEQIKGLMDSGKIGSANILYYDTYEDFEADADNIPAETLIVIKEYDIDDNSNSSSGNKPEEPSVDYSKDFEKSTDEELKSMLDSHYADEIDISDYWNIGDIRKIHLSAMSALENLGDSHAEQDIIIEIIGFDHDDLATSINGHTKAAITVQTREMLGDGNNPESGYIMGENTTVFGTKINWETSNRRKWCNNTFYNAISNTTIKNMVKPVKKKTYPNKIYNGSGLIETTDKTFFLSVAEVIKDSQTVKSVTKEAEGHIYDYFSKYNSTKKRNNQGIPCSTDANDVSWSLRSTHYDNSSGVGIMNTDSQTLGYGNVQSDSKGGIAPAWCM